MNKKILLLCGLGAIIFIMMIILIITSIFRNDSQTIEEELPPPVQYNTEQSNRLVDKVQNRSSLSTTDANIRSRLIQQVGGKSGVIQQTDSYRIEYLYAPDMFQIELTANNVQHSKAQAADWLKSTGLSQEGICNLPVSFYVNW